MNLQWTPTFEDISRNVQLALRSDSHDYVIGVLRELEANKSAIHAVLDTPPLNAGHRAQLKLGRTEIPVSQRCVRFGARALVRRNSM
jgi:hypothetical protein